MKKVLIVEDSTARQSIWAEEMHGRVIIIAATTIEDAERLFGENPDVDLIVMDACVPGEKPTTIPLVREIRKTFLGPMVAASLAAKFRELLMEAGCDYEATKTHLSEMILKILGV